MKKILKRVAKAAGEAVAFHNSMPLLINDYFVQLSNPQLIMRYSEYREKANRTMSKELEQMYSLKDKNLITKLESLHCVIGMNTELHEMVDGLQAGDEVNMKEEMGDLMWYIANYDNAQESEMEELPYINNEREKTPFEVESIRNPIEDLLDLWKKKFFYNTDKYDSSIIVSFSHLKHECIKFANANKWDLSEIMDTNIAKLEARYPEKFTTDKADNRDLNTERTILEK